MKTTYVGISEDHSISMRPITKAAARDFNEVISAIKDASLRESRRTEVTVVHCGAGNTQSVRLQTLNLDIKNIYPMPESSYLANGTGTPLLDSVGELIDQLSRYDNKDATFLIMVITDGLENASVNWTPYELNSKIRELQATDRWTFTFRVPRGNKRSLMRAFGIPEGNIIEWEQTEQDMARTTVQTRSAITQYYAGVKKGVTATKTFYANLADVKTSDVKAVLRDVSGQVRLLHVRPNDELVIRKFVEKRLGTFTPGTIYYQLTKRENRVTDRKNIVIRDSKKGEYYTGSNARDLLGLPRTGTVKVVPDDLGKFDIFIQSTSYNRKLVPGTTVLVMQ